MNRGTRLLALAVGVLSAPAFPRPSLAQLHDTFTNWIDHPSIAYRSTPTTDPVSQLNRRLQERSFTLQFEGESGYLGSVLRALDVPVASQISVFAPDSVQRARIRADNPRTLFFNDSVAVGWVRGGFVELAAQDPRQGVVFYALEQSVIGTPRLTRRDDCLSCHYSYTTVGVPGMLARSAGQFTVDHTTPLERRWGGWYVTGDAGSIRHLGNVPLDTLLRGLSPPRAVRTDSIANTFDATGYLSTHSDVVALMVFDHQMHMMNLLSRIGWEARVAESGSRPGNAAAAAQPGQSDPPIPLTDAAKEVVDYMLFIDEATFEGDVRSSSGFADEFAARGPRDRRGRSLRELDLHGRLMRYPCSYMIYAPVFDALPAPARAAIYQRMWSVLSGAEKDPRYARLSLAARRAVVEILRDTKQDLPDSFRQPLTR